MQLKHFLIGMATAACFTMPALAAPIQFTIDNITFGFEDPTGYNTGNSENHLNVRFDTAIAPGSFSLDLDPLTAPGASRTFDVGTVTLNETCINPASGCAGGTSRNETDALDVFVTFRFLAPLNGNQTFTLKGSAFAGLVNDAAEDYKLVFDPVQQFNFGNGGQFSIDLLDLSFINTGSQTLTATVTLLNAPAEVGGGNDVPEPGSLALMGLGLAGLIARGKRRKA